MTRDEFRTRITSAIGLSNQTGSSEQSLVDGWVYEGIVQVLLRTKLKVAKAQVSFIANEDDYVLPTEVLGIDRITMVNSSGNTIRLEPMSAVDMDDARAVELSGADPKYYSLEGYDMLRIWPKPSTSYDVVLHYTPRPGQLASGSSTPDYVPSEYHWVIEAYALWKAAEWDDDTSSKVGQTYQGTYELGIKQIKSDLNRRRGGWGPVHPRRRSRRNILKPGQTQV